MQETNHRVHAFLRVTSTSREPEPEKNEVWVFLLYDSCNFCIEDELGILVTHRVNKVEHN